MNTSNALTSVVTNVSGAIALGSAASSKTISIIQEHVPLNEAVFNRTQDVMSTTDIIAIGSFIILMLSFGWNLWSTRRRNNIADKNYQLEREKFELLKKGLEENKPHIIT